MAAGGPRATRTGNTLHVTVTGFPRKARRMPIFRGHVRHSVLPGNADGERITIAFNARL
ncbi:MAG: hypothetical protein ACU85V_19680 [Gammaproteobacteria bacterium]